MDPKDPIGGPMHRLCHGNDAGDGRSGCNFGWWDRDDWKFFLVEGKRLTQPKYAALEAEIRKIAVVGQPYKPPHQKPSPRR